MFFSLFAGAAASHSTLSLQQLCFECVRYELTGVCRSGVRPFISKFNVLPSRFLGKSGYDFKNGQFLSLAETIFPEKIGVLDSSFDSQDCETDTSLFVRFRMENEDAVDWVDKALLRAFSKLRAEQPEKGSDSFKDILSELDNRTSEPVSEAQEDAPEIQELSWTDRNGSLRRFNYGVEDFSVNELDGKRSLVDVSDTIIVRRTFDEKMRLLQKELFPVAQSARKMTLSSVIQYSYENDAVIPASLTEQDLVNNKKTVTTYSATGKELSTEIYHLDSGDDKTASKTAGKASGKTADKSQGNVKSDKKKEAVEKIDEKRLYTYDEEDRLIQEEKTVWRYAQNTKGKETSEHSDYRWQYTYGEHASVPDTEYFEDGKLRVRTVYTSENQYTETMFFDGGYEVNADYVDGIKVLEVISINGKELRRGSFEE